MANRSSVTEEVKMPIEDCSEYFDTLSRRGQVVFLLAAVEQFLNWAPAALVRIGELDEESEGDGIEAA